MDYCVHDNNTKTCFYCKINQRKEEKEKFIGQPDAILFKEDEEKLLFEKEGIIKVLFSPINFSIKFKIIFPIFSPSYKHISSFFKFGDHFG